MSAPGTTTGRAARSSLRLGLAAAAILVLIVAMAFDTRIVRIGSGAALPPGAFDAADYGKSKFPPVQSAILGRAVDAATLEAAIVKDRSAAAKQYGVGAGSGAEISVKFTGVAGKDDFGVYPVKIGGLPDSLTVRVQTGPAIYGTDLRDATGTISFGQFTNQIDYQNAASALNKQMKRQVLARIDASKLTGKTISVIGVFELANPNSWLVTPVKLDVR